MQDFWRSDFPEELSDFSRRVIFTQFLLDFVRFFQIPYIPRAKKFLHCEKIACSSVTNGWSSPCAIKTRVPQELCFFSLCIAVWPPKWAKQNGIGYKKSAFIFLSTEGLLCCSTNTYDKKCKILKNWKSEVLKVKNWTWCHDPEPPLHCSCVHGTVEGGRFFGNLIGPRRLCEIFAAAIDALVLDAGPLLEPPVPPLVRLRAPWSLLRGLCWNHRFRPLCSCRPWSVILDAFARRIF